MGHTGRPIAALSLASLMLGIAGSALWYQDMRYALPTPRPRGLVQAPVGSSLAARIQAAGLDVPNGQPVALHFYNPDCPCSQFNLDHLRKLVRSYGSQVRFIAVVEGDRHGLAAFDSAGLNVPANLDSHGAIAAACGVYSTPQAVLLDAEGKLYYRGNYNSARYCVSPASEYVRIALESLVAGQPSPTFTPGATVAYGCAIPR